MTFDLFGYRGVFEFDQKAVNKLLSTYLYERHLVSLNGTLTDGDFFSVMAPIQTPDGSSASVQVYLELGRPFLHIQTDDGSNLVTLHIPFSALGAFVTVGNAPPVRRSVPPLALVVFDCAVVKTASGLSVDFSKVTPQSIGIESINIQAGPTGVGGQQVGFGIPLDDNIITNELKDKDGNITITGGDLRKELADFVQKGTIGPTSVPLSLGGAKSALATFDLLLFGNTNDRDILDMPADAGADLLLYDADGTSGQGVSTDATQILPVARENPPYTWTLSIAESVLQGDIKRALDAGSYWVQDSDAVNSTSNPRGFVVVPPAGSRKGTLPGGGGITVNSPQGGQCQVSIAVGGLTPNGRAHVSNLNRHIDAGFEADENGAASFSIRADAGERLAVTIEAVSLPNHSDIIIWRPTLSFHDGNIEAAFHYHYNIPNWCDLYGDATVAFELVADRTKPFMVSVQVVDANASVPWWVYVVTWLGAGVLGQDIFAPILIALIPTIIHSVAGGLIGGDVSSVAGGLTDQLSAPSPENVALLLDQVDLHETGIQISGRSDASILLNYGRVGAFSIQTGVVLEANKPAPVYMRFNWAVSLGSISITSPVPLAVIKDQAPETFWGATFDDLPPNTEFQRDPFTMFAGDAVLVWVAVESGYAKVLFERDPFPSMGIRVTWVAYRGHVARAIRLINKLKSTVVGGLESLTLEKTLYAYDGSIDLSPQKFFLSEETQAIGDEHWFWDDQELTVELGIFPPGGSITLDAANRRLLVHLDQSGVSQVGQQAPFAHWVRFQGTDVFGNMLQTKLLVQTPSITFRPRPISLVHPGRIDPLGGDTGPGFDPAMLVSMLIDFFAPQVGTAQAGSLAVSLANALATGTGRIDSAGASTILALLSDAGREANF